VRGREVFGMSTAEILAELPKLTRDDRRRILEMENEAQSVEAIRRMADEAFQMLDAMEAEDAARVLPLGARCRE
jgi:hypothetical protein